MLVDIDTKHRLVCRRFIYTTVVMVINLRGVYKVFLYRRIYFRDGYQNVMLAAKIVYEIYINTSLIGIRDVEVLQSRNTD